MDILQSDADASERFWALEERINKDKKKPGVQMQLYKSDMDFDLARLIKDGVINIDDLEGFSQELIDRIGELTNIY